MKYGMTEGMFLQLLIAMFKIQGYSNNDNNTIARYQLQRDLFKYCKDPKFSCLFDEVKDGISESGEFVGLDPGFDLMESFGFLITDSYNYKEIYYRINLTPERAQDILDEYPVEIQKAASELTLVLSRGKDGLQTIDDYINEKIKKF